MNKFPAKLPLHLLLLLFALAFNACHQASPPAPTITLTPVTATPAASTATSRPTLAPSATVAPSQATSATTTSAVAITETRQAASVLSPEQLTALNAAATRYLSDTQEKADATVREMNYALGANASLTCGPLAFAILQDAGLVSPYFTLNEFWLISPLPEKNETLFLEVFPPEQYQWLRDTTPMAEMDFTTDPLLPGDFIYTFGGNYEHMFVVTRVDADGSAYTVQNIEAGYLNGDPEDTSFVIAETLLYSPGQPGAGVIYQWADRTNWKLGLTGVKGYYRFRPITPIPAPDPRKIALAEAIDGVITTTGGLWYIQIETLEGDVLYSRRPGYTIHPASVIKVAIAVGTLQWLESQQEPGQTLEQQLARGPAFNETENDRSYQQLLTAMLVNSEELAADILFENLDRSPLRLKPMLQSWGLTHTVLEPRQSTTADLVTLFRKLYQGELLSAEATAYVLDLMSTYTPNDDLRLGQVKTVLGDEIVLYNKRGSLLAPQLIVADGAILQTGEETILLQVFAYQDVALSTTYESLEAAIGEIAVIFAQWLQTP
ncbi:MAG: serine hydrolase [Anaerolineae bacterium]|nr:serine hydrolase [Anaerolineae bacterium]